MRIQPVPRQPLPPHGLRPRNQAIAHTLPRSTRTSKRLIHLPLRAGVEKGQRITPLQRAAVDDAHLHLVHVEVHRRRAGVVAEDEVRVQLDVGVPARLHRSPCFLARRGFGDLGQDGAGREVDERDCPAAEGFGASDDLDEVGVGWWR